MAANIVYWNLRHVRRHEQTLHSSLVYEEHSEKARLEVYWPYDLKWIRGGLGWIEVDWRGGLEVDWPSVLRWIGGGLGWIGVDWHPSRRKCDVVIFVFRAFGRLKKPPGAGQLYNINKEKERLLASVA